MKYLEVPELVTLQSRYLDGLDLGDRIVNGTLEAYSIKMVSSDRKKAKELDLKFEEESKVSPTLGQSPLGPLSKSSTRKLLINLITTMNASFPDYDFSNARPDQFEQEENHFLVVQHVNFQLLDAIVQRLGVAVREEFWATVDNVIHLERCDVFRFLPDVESDVFNTEDKLWSFTYFFFNRQLKKMLIFSCSAESKLHHGPPSSQPMDREGDEDEAEVEEEEDWTVQGMAI